MSECVVRMEMPQACWFCGLRFVCKAANDFMTTKEVGCSVLKVGMPGCLIVCQLPEGHGRLVDADALKEKAVHYSETEYHFDHDAVEVDDIEDAPTIVPAEAESPSPKPTDPLPICGVEYVPTEVDVQTGTVTYELRERSET